jgi:hypothetical protein
MVQLRVEDGNSYVWIDLYETEPIILSENLQLS